MEDVTGDGDLELILQLSDGSVRCYSALSGHLLWQCQLSRSSSTLDLRLVDIDNDIYVVIATADDGLVCCCIDSVIISYHIISYHIISFSLVTTSVSSALEVIL